MWGRSFPIGIFAISLLAGATTAQAAIETWVSGTGSDAGTCPRTAPCRTFQFAHDQTNNNGSINVLTAGNFGPVTITKPISIVAEGVEAVINTAVDVVGENDAGIIIQAGGTAVVSLRGLTIDLRGASSAGVLFRSGGALHVRDCMIRRTGLLGIFFSVSSGTKELYVADSVIADSGTIGIDVQATGGAHAKAVLDRVRVENSLSAGIVFATHNTSTVTATVRDSVTSGNASAGLFANGSANSTIDAMVDRLTSVNNAIGIWANEAGATVRIGNSTVSGNVTGLSVINGASIVSYGTNKVDGNGTDGEFTGTLLMK